MPNSRPLSSSCLADFIQLLLLCCFHCVVRHNRVAHVACSLHLCLFLLVGCVASQSNVLAEVPTEYAYLLPRPFNDTFTQPFVDIALPTGEAASTLLRARNVSFMSYDADFNTTVESATVVEIASSNTS